MGLLNFIRNQADPLEIYIKFIQDEINEIPELKNLNPESKNQNELKEFRNFITILIASSLYTLKVKQYLKVREFPKGDPIDSKIFRTTLKLTLPFYRSYVINGKIIIGLFDNSLFTDEKMCLADFIPRLNRYEKELKETFETGNPYFIEEHEPEYDEDSAMLITGRKIYFEYIRLLFLTKIDEHEIGSVKANEHELWELDDDTIYDSLMAFSKPLNDVFETIEIRPQMLH